MRSISVKPLATILLLAALSVACSRPARGLAETSPQTPATTVPEPTVAPASPVIVERRGLCDASAAVPIDATSFVVASDEDNLLRVYARDPAPAPSSTLDLGPFLDLEPEEPEADIEGATRVGNVIYWITSHGASKKGKARPNRRRLFATEVKTADGHATIKPMGKPYKNLVEDLVNLPALSAYALAAAATKVPKEMGALNIEGLAATPEGDLLIGFRNPIPGGKALIVPLQNPTDVVEGKAAQLGQPIFLSLGGLGIRSIERFEDRREYLIVAGPYGEEGGFKLYRWSGSAADDPSPIDSVSFDGLYPEALFAYPREKQTVEVLSDDGIRPVGGSDCKDAPAEDRSFRAFSATP